MALIRLLMIYALLTATTVTLAVTALPAPRLLAQTSCPPAIDPGSESIAGAVDRPQSSCTVADGTFVRAGSSYRVHMWGTARGSCTVYQNDPPACTAISTTLRHVTYLRARAYYSPSSYDSMLLASTYNSLQQSADTRVVGSTTASPNGGSYSIPSSREGEAALTLETLIGITACKILPESVATTISVNVVKCIPQFLTHSSGNILRLPSGNWNIWIDPNNHLKVREAWSKAIDDWEAVNPNVNFEKVTSDCGGQSGCTRIVTGTVSGDCATGAIVPVVGGNGIIDHSTITFPAAASNWDDKFLRRLAGHELGHHFGLADNSNNCTAPKSQMAPTQCTAQNGFPETPPFTDHKPVTQTVYGGTPFAACS